MIASVAIAAFIVFFLSSGGNKTVNDDNLRSGQAHHDTSITAPVAPAPSETTVSSTTEYTTKGNIDPLVEEENLDQTVEEVESGIQDAEEEEIRKEESMLSSAVDGMSNLLRIRMGKRFGNTLSTAEVEEVATEVEERLQDEVSNGLRNEADAIVQREIDGIERTVELGEEAGYSGQEIEQKVYAQEGMAVDTLIEDIDVAAGRVKDTMETRAAEIEKQILELRLTAKLGKQVKLVIVDDEVQMGADDVNLAPPTTAAVPANRYGSTNAAVPANPYGSTVAYGTSPVSAYNQAPQVSAAEPSNPFLRTEQQGNVEAEPNNPLLSTEKEDPVDTNVETLVEGGEEIEREEEAEGGGW